MAGKFDYVMAAIKESNNLNTVTVDELQSSLLVHEQRMRAHIKEEQVLKMTLDDRAGGSNDCQNDGRSEGKGGFKERGRGRGRQTDTKVVVECYK